MSKKEQQQIVVLGALVVVILGVLGYMNRDSLIPESSGGITYSGITKQPIPQVNFDTLFERTDFQALTAFGDVPVKSDQNGVENPFEPLEE